MSKLLTPSIYSNKGLENNWVNLIWNSHDMICGCNNPWKHLSDILQRQGTQLCLPSPTADIGTSTDPDITEEDGIKEGDLEKLFAEDFGEGDG